MHSLYEAMQCLFLSHNLAYFIITFLSNSIPSFVHPFKEDGIEFIELLAHIADMSLDTFLCIGICEPAVAFGRIGYEPFDRVRVMLGRWGLRVVALASKGPAFKLDFKRGKCSA